MGESQKHYKKFKSQTEKAKYCIIILYEFLEKAIGTGNKPRVARKWE